MPSQTEDKVHHFSGGLFSKYKKESKPLMSNK
jgi:hypothetical protein